MEWDHPDSPGRNTDSGASKAAAGRKRGLGVAVALPQSQGQAGAKPGTTFMSLPLLGPLGGWSNAAPDAAAPAFWLVPECGELPHAPAARGSPVHTPACPRSWQLEPGGGPAAKRLLSPAGYPAPFPEDVLVVPRALTSGGARRH